MSQQRIYHRVLHRALVFLKGVFADDSIFEYSCSLLASKLILDVTRFKKGELYCCPRGELPLLNVYFTFLVL